MTDPATSTRPKTGCDRTAEDTTPTTSSRPKPAWPPPWVGGSSDACSCRAKQQALAVQGSLSKWWTSSAPRASTGGSRPGRVLSMLGPGAMERQNDVMTLFKQQQLHGQRPAARRHHGPLNGTLDAMNESQKTSSRTITDLIGRSPGQAAPARSCAAPSAA